MTVIVCANETGTLAVGLDILFGSSPSNVTAGECRVWTVRIFTSGFFIGAIMAIASLIAIELYLEFTQNSDEAS